MAVLVDSGIWIAFYNKYDQDHQKAVELMEEINTGTYGRLASTDYILDEAVNHCLSRYSADKSLLVGEAIRNTTEMIKITYDMLEKAWELFKDDKKKPNGKFLSFTDCTSIIVAKTFNIQYTATFDGRFKKYVNVLLL